MQVAEVDVVGVLKMPTVVNASRSTRFNRVAATPAADLW
jgi:hypothetical protein